MNLRRIKQLLLVFNDIVFLGCSFILSCYLVKYPFFQMTKDHWVILPFIIVGQLFVFLKSGLYSAVLRYASINFLMTVLKAVIVATGILILGFTIAGLSLPPAVIFINWLQTVFFIGGSRLLVRYYFEMKQHYQGGRKVLIYGAGDMGALAMRQLLLNKSVIYSPVGFIDDSKEKFKRVIHGVKVLGFNEDLEELIQKHKVEEIVVAIAEIDSKKLHSVVQRCRKMHVACRIIPCFSRLIEIEPSIRTVELADLMRRPSKDLDRESIRRYIENKTVLITGAAGSIGSEITRQCLQYSPKTILALDQSECNLYYLEEEFWENTQAKGLVKYLLCDTKNKQVLETIFNAYCPDVVFHAAAYKHVPLLEKNPTEGLRNNISSTKNLCEIADKYKVKRFIMISTDKAVKPSSIMGASKAICEMFVQNYNEKSEVEFVSVRFGNVLGSSGSVVPKFKEQIKKGGPVTVTHPDATRYFMLIDEAVQLVLQAAVIGKGGEIFILDMGKPVKIKDMAEDLIYLMGREPYKDIQIQFSGLREGEKIYEELFNDEIEKPTPFREITIGKSRIVDWSWLEKNINDLLSVTENGNVEDAYAIMEKLVPEGSFAGRNSNLEPIRLIKGDRYR